MPKLSLKAGTKLKDGNFVGELFFEASDKKMTVQYFFGEGQPKKSLDIGDELNITFKIKDEEFSIKGIFPEVLNLVSERAQCLWALAHTIIYSNVFMINASTEGESTDIRSVSQDMSGGVGEDTVKVLFGNTDNNLFEN